MKERLTATLVRSLEPKETEYVVWDTELTMFGVRVRTSGQKSYVLQYRFHGKFRKKTIGTVQNLTPEIARKQAAKDLAIIAGGEDPAKKENEQALFSCLCDRYLEWAKTNKKTWKEDKIRIDRELLPALGKRSITEITRYDIEKSHSRVGRKTPTEANRIKSLASAMFTRADRWGMIPPGHPNPAKGIDKFKENRRDRWVKPEEIGRLLEAIHAEENIYYRAGLLLYLVTGLRNRELVSIPWKNVDLERGEAYLPDTKSGRSFTLKLSPAAIEIFQWIPVTESIWIFPGKSQAKHLLQFPRKSWYRVRERAGMPDLHIHDLRRTFGSWLATQGTPLKVIAALLNQSSQSITDTVYAHLADDPLREASGSVGENILRFDRIKKKEA